MNTLRLFMMYQHGRTQGAAEHLNQFASMMAKATLREKLARDKSATIRPEALDLVNIRLKDAPNESLWQTVKSMPAFLDLSAKFIFTDRTPGFVISDDPVVVYNQFVETNPNLRHYPTSNGLMLKGLQMFMPLSPSMMLAFYDPGTYEYGGKRTVCKAGPQDIAYLNRMQAVAAESCLYFHEDRIDDAALEDL